MTLRRDIAYLEQEGEAIKVRGGARSKKYITASMEDNFASRMGTNATVKESLARAALPFIEAGRSIFLDSGTTMLSLAHLMPDSRVTVTTTGPNIAMELLKKSQPVINIVGGMLNRDNITASGRQAQRFLEDINIDVAFVVPSGVSARNGFSCGNYSECDLKRLVVQKARQTILLLDSSKTDKSLPYTFAAVGDADVIVTDQPLAPDLRQIAGEKGIRIIVAKS